MSFLMTQENICHFFYAYDVQDAKDFTYLTYNPHRKSHFQMLKSEVSEIK